MRVISQDGFESLVNSDRSQTSIPLHLLPVTFESLVNSDRSQTDFPSKKLENTFESLVNSDRSQTCSGAVCVSQGVRAVLIQIGVKHIMYH